MAERKTIRDRKLSDSFFAPTTDGAPAATQRRKTGDSSAVSRRKATYYLSEEALTAIDELQLAIRKRTGTRPDKSDLVEQAIMLLKQQNS